MLDRIRSGDEAAYAELLDREWPALVRFLTRRLGSGEAAEDAAQEAFIRLWERREQWTAGSARALLYRIGANAAADLDRKAAARTRLAAHPRLVPGPSPATPVEELEHAELHARLARALDALPPRRRDVFELVRREGLSYAEVAEVLELAPQTVANHMGLALRDLRAELAGFTGDAGARSRDDVRSNDG